MSGNTFQIKDGDVATIKVTGRVYDSSGDKFVRGVYIGNNTTGCPPEVEIVSYTRAKPAWVDAKVIRATYKGRRECFMRVHHGAYLVWKSEFDTSIYPEYAGSVLEDVEVIVP